MIEDIGKAVVLYRGLTTLGKRLFRDEVGLASLKARAGRRKTMRKTTGRVRVKKGAAETPAATGTVE